MIAANAYFWLIFLALALLYALDTLANWLNIRALKPSLPDEFHGIYDAEDYLRFLRYTATTSRFEWVENTFNFAVLLAFWFCGGYGFLDRAVRAAQLGPIGSGLLFMGGLWFAHWLINLPFDVYETFVVEERFGFNKTTL